MQSIFGLSARRAKPPKARDVVVRRDGDQKKMDWTKPRPGRSAMEIE